MNKLPWFIQMFIVMACLVLIAWLASPVQAEGFQQKSFLVNANTTLIITNQPCHIGELVQQMPLFAYARSQDEDKNVTFTAGCYAELDKPNRFVIQWTNGNVISVPAENFQDITEL